MLKLNILMSLILFVWPLFSQEINKQPDSKPVYFFGPTVGIALNANNGNFVLNTGFSFELQHNSNLYNVYYQSFFDYGPESLNGSDKEFSFTYSRIFGLKKVFFGIGSGVSIIKITNKLEWISEDTQKRVQTIKMGIPVEFRIGTMNPDKSIRLIDLNFFGNINSETSYYGCKIHFNIKL
ncbi:MAG: hypothetical protein H6627_05800 [Calditrichae bacterium]|nr:hypothetical protein [Calditrichia bacterium]